MRNLLLFICLIPVALFAQVTGSTQIVEKTVVSYNDVEKLNFLVDSSLYTEGWNELPQSKFWQQVINLSSDTCLVNVASERTLVNKVCRADWTTLTEEQKRL